mmetsp:Transcript_71710/g.214069  ORF Transcript_71710/g.214069 Transcript_71710/m.214069 type:complete len:244 (-) Transcript_71710:91-822(-)
MYNRPPFFTSTVSPSSATIRLINASPDLSPPTTALKAGGGLKTITSLRSYGRQRLEILSTVSWSPTSNVGYMDNEGMNRGSTMKPRMVRATAREEKNVFRSSCVSGERLLHLYLSRKLFSPFSAELVAFSAEPAASPSAAPAALYDGRCRRLLPAAVPPAARAVTASAELPTDGRALPQGTRRPAAEGGEVLSLGSVRSPSATAPRRAAGRCRSAVVTAARKARGARMPQRSSKAAAQRPTEP